MIVGPIDPAGAVTFPDGLPGFETARRFVLVASPALEPFTCVHGVDVDGPTFLAIDPRRVVPDYRCDLTASSRARLEVADAPLLWLAIVSRTDHGARVNLRAPLVINPETMRGWQVLDGDASYAIDHPLTGA